MRKSTLLWLGLATFCGVVLFHTSQKVHDAREEIAALNAAAQKEEESIRVLQAEWSHLNQPERLEKLVKTYLKLVPLKGNQFTRLETIPLVTDTPGPEAVAVVEEPPPVKIRTPRNPVSFVAEKPVVKKTAPAASAATDLSHRRFGDVMKSLGVD